MLKMRKEYICGIDENGFGPILGPLVITGVIAEKEIEFSEKIKDSKEIYRKVTDFSKIEEVAILFFYILKKRFPLSPFEIYKTLVETKCNFEENICEKNIPTEFTVSKTEIFDKYRDLMKNLNKIKEIKSKIVCPYFFNQFIRKNSKFILNLSKFCEIIKEFENYRNVKYFCGKIGFFYHYYPYLLYFFPEHEIKILCENTNFSKYLILKDNVEFEIGFYKDVEKVSPVAAISSIIGKYIREIVMESIRKSLQINKKISGYRDKKTKNYLENFKYLNINLQCLIREK